MKSIVEVVTDAELRPAVIEDTVQLIDNQVRAKRGITGAAIKTGYKVVSKLKGGRMVPRAVDILLDDFAEALQPLFDEYGESNTSGFGNYLVQHKERSAEALVAVTDRRAHEAEQAILRSTYNRLRPQAIKHVGEALQELGDVIERHAG